MAPIVLTLDAVSKQYRERPLLDAVSLAIATGERVGVVGVNGSGKTTLLRIAAGVETPDSGRVSLARDLRIAYLSQNAALDPALTIFEQIFQGDTPLMRLLRDYEGAAAALADAPGDRQLQQQLNELIERMDAASAWELERHARSILTELGVTERTARIGELSGGQRKRVALAAALIQPADLLILDEPTNQIDTATIAWLESYLARSTAALLLVTHDRYFLDRVVERIVEVDNARLHSYPGSYSRFLELRAERLAQLADDEARRQTILKKELVWLQRGAQARTTKQQARIERIETMQAATPEAQRGELEISVASRRLGKKVIEVAGVSKRIGERTLFRDLTLSVAPRDRIGILGPNGSGKTTLLNLLAGRLTPDSGTITIGETVHLAYYDQESAGLDETQRVIDYVREGAELARTGDGSLVTASQMLERFLFPATAHYSLVATLSGGERRRLYLLRTLMAAPNVLLLDEPTNDLDLQTLAVLEDYLDDFAGALIVVTHDRYFLDRTVERTLAFESGAVIEYPGGYSAYAAAVARRMATVAAPAPAKPKQAPVEQARARRLTFKETRELGELEERVAALEAEQTDLQRHLDASAADYRAVERLSADLARISAELERTFARWAELAEIAEQTR